MNKIASIYLKIPLKQRRIIRHVFYGIKNIGYSYIPEEGLNILKIKIILFFYLHPKLKRKYLNEIRFIKNKAHSDFSYSFVFPYDYIYNYSFNNIKVFKDVEKELFYVIHYGKKLYFKRSIKTEEEIQIAYFCILIEQDEKSPHRYLNNEFNIDQNSIVLDIGAAEGVIGLENIEKIRKLYIFEANIEWLEALEATFEPWKEKVIIINKYVSNNNEKDNITLDRFFGENPIDFIKIDVEGAELSIFEGAKDILKRNSIKIAVCTYHRQSDANEIEKLLHNNSFNCLFTNNYMLFVLSNLNPPYFRKALIRSQKLEKH